MTAPLKTAIHEHEHLPDIVRKQRAGYLSISNHFTRYVNRCKNTSISQLYQLARIFFTEHLALTDFAM